MDLVKHKTFLLLLRINILKKTKLLRFANKRQKIVITSALISVGLLYTQLVPFYLTQKFILALAALAYLLSLWALWEGISKIKAFVLLILPTLFTLAVASYYFLLPVRWLTRLPVAFIFGLAFYFLMLSQNVFNVASIRTIPLYRAASTVAFLFTLITSYLLFKVIFSFHLLFIWNGVVVFLLSFLLILQIIWSIEMESINKVVIFYSLVLAAVIGELALTLSFWPISGGMLSLVLSSYMYVILGIVTNSLRDRLDKRITWEYLVVGVIVYLVSFFTTSWTG